METSIRADAGEEAFSSGPSLISIKPEIFLATLREREASKFRGDCKLVPPGAKSNIATEIEPLLPAVVQIRAPLCMRMLSQTSIGACSAYTRRRFPLRTSTSMCNMYREEHVGHPPRLLSGPQRYRKRVNPALSEIIEQTQTGRNHKS